MDTQTALTFINELKDSLWLGLDLKKITHYYDTSVIGEECGRVVRFGDISRLFQARANQELPHLAQIDIEDCITESNKMFIRLRGRLDDGTNNHAHLLYHLNDQNQIIRIWSMLEHPQHEEKILHTHAIKFLV